MFGLSGRDKTVLGASAINTVAVSSAHGIAHVLTGTGTDPATMIAGTAVGVTTFAGTAYFLDRRI